MPTPAYDVGYVLPSLLAAAPTPSPTTVPQLLAPIAFVSSSYVGRGRVAGTTKIKGTPDFPTRARVRLVREIDAICVEEVWSDPVTGEYEFEGWDETLRYTVLAYDPSGTFRATLASGVLPEFVG